MQKTVRRGALLAGALTALLPLAAQQGVSGRARPQIDVAALFSLERGQLAQTNRNSFWLKGGSAEGAVTFWKGFGVAANLTGEYASNIQNNVNLGKISYMVGPRLTVNVPRHGHAPGRYPVHVFGEALFGGVHGFDSVFPGAASASTSANAFSMQLGGGVDITLKKGLGLRLPEVDYVHMTLPNNASNSQNDFRLAFGVVYRH